MTQWYPGIGQEMDAVMSTEELAYIPGQAR